MSLSDLPFYMIRTPYSMLHTAHQSYLAIGIIVHQCLKNAGLVAEVRPDNRLPKSADKDTLRPVD